MTPAPKDRQTHASSERAEIARESYRAYGRADREFFESHLSEDFTFSSPPDPLLDRAGWWERCWPGAGSGQELSFVRVIESGDEVVITYEQRRDQGGGRNTEVLTFDAENKIVRTEVYFGWNL
jgi:hypothetical protein